MRYIPSGNYIVHTQRCNTIWQHWLCNHWKDQQGSLKNCKKMTSWQKISRISFIISYKTHLYYYMTLLLYRLISIWITHMHVGEKVAQMYSKESFKQNDLLQHRSILLEIWKSCEYRAPRRSVAPKKILFGRHLDHEIPP